MKILFLCEPYPTRNSFGSHTWIASKILSVAIDAVEKAIPIDIRFAVDVVTYQILLHEDIKFRQFLLLIDPQSKDFFENSIDDWETIGVKKWKKILEGTSDIDIFYEKMILDLKDRFNFDVLMYWGNNKTLFNVSKNLDIKYLACELGALRGPFGQHYCIDTKGVNGDAKHLMLNESDLHVISPVSILDSLKRFKYCDICLHEYLYLLPKKYDMVAQLADTFVEYDRIVLIALQLADDSNTIVFGDGWTAADIIEQTISRCANTRTLIVVRPHPASDASYINYIDSINAKNLIDDKDDIIILEGDLNPIVYLNILNMVDEVVTINSSVGFEAAVLGKKVQVFGHASYIPTFLRSYHKNQPEFLDRRVIKLLLDEYYISEDDFFSPVKLLDIISEKLHLSTNRSDILSRYLPLSELEVSGRVDFRQNRVKVGRHGSFPISKIGAAGLIDKYQVYEDGFKKMIYLEGWAIDLRTKGPVAALVIFSSTTSIILQRFLRRSDVADISGASQALYSGFVVRLSAKDLPEFLEGPLEMLIIHDSGYISHIDMVFRPD